jgi:hypothetical protein
MVGGLLESNGRGVMVGGDGIDLMFTEGWRSTDLTPAARDPDVETTERSDAIDFWGSSGLSFPVSAEVMGVGLQSGWLTGKSCWQSYPSLAREFVGLKAAVTDRHLQRS